MCEKIHNSERPSKDEWFLQLAEKVAERSTCLRKQVGCIIVKDGLIISTGYNGVARGEDECPEQGCCSENSDNCNTIHAEINAIVNAARLGISIYNAHIYCTLKPCSDCTRVLINAGISKVFYKLGQYVYENGHNINIKDYIETVKM